ncbi:MAG: thermitase [Verrucomicrobiota bacterium]
MSCKEYKARNDNGTRRKSKRIHDAWLRPLRILEAALFFLLCTAAAKGAPHSVPGQILVKPSVRLSELDFNARLRANGATYRKTLRPLNVRIVNVPESRTEAVLAALRSDADIEFAERDFVAQAAFVPNDPLVVSGSEWHLATIHAPEAWDITMGGTNTIVAVLDSGINAAHPEFAGRLLPGYDFVSNDNDPSDDFGHGTAVAGTIVADGNNGMGVAGVAYGCSVLPVKVVDASGFASYSTIAQGIKYAVDHGARVINLSVAGDSTSATLQSAINYAWNNNVVVVAAAGNNANTVPQYPAACDHVIAVSATEPDDSLAGFSSYGSYITVSAPGDNIWTTQKDLSNPYGAWRGTSFASPIVAGVAALVASANPSLSNTQIVALLKQTADDVGVAGYDTSFGFGRINAFRAVSAANSAPGAQPPPPPPVEVVETNPPSVTVSSGPPNGARLTSPLVSFAGSAADNVGVERVEVQINSDATQVANGTTNWNSSVDLMPGPNVIHIRSVDLAGNISPEIVRTCTYVVKVPLIVQTSGIGRVSPDLNGAALEVGKSYRVRAIPGSGQVFAGWEGESSESPALDFVMSANLILVAKFVPSPFPPVKGSYAGLIANTNGVTLDSSGSFHLIVTRSGTFSGRILVGGERHGFHGRFNLAGDATVSVRRQSAGPLTVSLHVDLAAATDQVAGYITDGNWTSAVAGDRDVFNSRFNPSPQAGVRSFVLQRADNSAMAASASSSISSGGAVRVHGKLGDGRPFSAGSTLAKNGDYPFFLSLNRSGEIVIGWLNFPAMQNPAISGAVVWLKTGTNTLATVLQAASAQN